MPKIVKFDKFHVDAISQFFYKYTFPDEIKQIIINLIGRGINHYEVSITVFTKTFLMNYCNIENIYYNSYDCTACKCCHDECIHYSKCRFFTQKTEMDSKFLIHCQDINCSHVYCVIHGTCYSEEDTERHVYCEGCESCSDEYHTYCDKCDLCFDADSLEYHKKCTRCNKCYSSEIYTHVYCDKCDKCYNYESDYNDKNPHKYCDKCKSCYDIEEHFKHSICKKCNKCYVEKYEYYERNCSGKVFNDLCNRCMLNLTPVKINN